MRDKGAHKVLSEKHRPMQSRVAAKLALPGKKAVSRSPMAADGRDHALAAGAADIAGNLSP